MNVVYIRDYMMNVITELDIICERL